MYYENVSFIKPYCLPLVHYVETKLQKQFLLNLSFTFQN